MPAGPIPVNARDVAKFNPEIGECCTADDFRLHLNGTPSHVWNKSATRILVNSFLEKHKDQYEARIPVIREMVLVKCTAAVKYEIKKYKDEKKRAPSSGSAEAQRLRKNRAERKRTLFHRRRDLTFFYPALRSQREKLDLLGIAGMSSDEEEKVGGRRQWRILAPRWRAARVTGWLRYFDAIYEKGREASGNDRGAFPRHRGSARTTSDNKKFPEGLPRNAYRQTWLDSLVDVENVVRPIENVRWTHDDKIVE
ncbi:hypothetical protein BJ322DRAFT_999565 [Thelephora terrestris]|uniref:Uncharacterized protein n=1 Tax=Thelephora terrestris TaxID=56493 RepID=A0A9P6HN16_9AGAM|nr:hypothetical protein BJ322DRAFT_999565 [Thelephora terrestris]